MIVYVCKRAYSRQYSKNKLISLFVVWNYSDVICCRNKKGFLDILQIIKRCSIPSVLRCVTLYENVFFWTKEASLKELIYQSSPTFWPFSFSFNRLYSLIYFSSQYTLTPHRIMLLDVIWKTYFSIRLFPFVCVSCHFSSIENKGYVSMYTYECHVHLWLKNRMLWL